MSRGSGFEALSQRGHHDATIVARRLDDGGHLVRGARDGRLRAGGSAEAGAAAAAGPGCEAIRRAEEFIRPRPLDPIPDDPPPHEGAMLAMPSRIQAPDLILVEVLEALPGRPISGERLVQPDGNVHLGFYGEVNVAGLTIRQAKVKIVLHLRQFLMDRTLGLVRYDETGKGMDVTRMPIDIPMEEVPRLEFPPQAAGPREDPLAPTERDKPRPKEMRRGREDQPAKPWRESAKAVRQAAEARPSMPEEPLLPAVQGGGRYEVVDPADSHAVFVCLAAYNSQVYYVQGDVGSPGRLTWTGHETVLDAINFGGGLLGLVADRHKIQLHRPAGKQPAKTFHIDLDAIERGDRTANLQIFPGDRLVVGRKADLPPR